MAKIIIFPAERAREMGRAACVLEGPTAEIIIFPGIRFEQAASGIALAK